MTESNSKVIKTPDIINHWQSFGSCYTQYFEYDTQPMLYSLIVSLKLNLADRILELSCGGGKSLSVVCSLKKPQCEYLATDICENLLSLASKRMEYIETNFLGNLQYFDGSSFDIKQKKTWKSEFPKSKVNFALMNNEDLDLKNEIFDRCFSNLSLQIVEKPEKMLAESFRVLKTGGRAGFTVWASRENSLFFTIPNIIFKKHEVEMPNDRTSFHLNDKKLLITMMENAGFKNILCWPQFYAYNFHTEEEFNLNLDTEGFQKFFNLVKDEEEKRKIRKEILNEYMSHINKNQPVGLEVFLVLGDKI